MRAIARSLVMKREVSLAEWAWIVVLRVSKSGLRGGSLLKVGLTQKVPSFDSCRITSTRPSMLSTFGGFEKRVSMSR